MNVHKTIKRGSPGRLPRLMLCALLMKDIFIYLPS